MSAPAALIRRLVVIDLDATEPTVTAPYTARPIIKSLYWPLRRWDANRSVWVVKTAGIRALITDLRAAGYDVDLWSGGQMRTLAATATPGRRP